jgi:hypothetical protein
MLAFAMAICAPSVLAAEFELVTNGDAIEPDETLSSYFGPTGQGPSCNMRLTGEIKDGDLERLANVVAQIKSRQCQGLCLNSPGGSFQEAIRISRTMLGKDTIPAGSPGLPLWTVIEAGAECYSACSIIFMAGNTYQEAEGWGPAISRYLHVQGKLGFHAPFIFNIKDPSFKDQTVESSLQKIEQAFRAGLKATREIAELGVGSNMGGRMSNYNIMPLHLIVEMLSKGAEELFLIDTVIKAERYKIQLFGAKPPSRIGVCELQNFCLNHHYGNLENTGLHAAIPESFPPSEPCKKPAKSLQKGAETYLYFDYYGGEGTGFCVVKLPRSKNKLPLIYSSVVYGDPLHDYDFLPGRATDFYVGARLISSLPVQ